MLKRFFLFVVFVCLIQGASETQAAPRNLLTEYQVAINNLDVQKVQSLLNEGINLSDAVKETLRSVAKKINAEAYMSDSFVEGSLLYITDKLKNFNEYANEAKGGVIRIGKVSSKNLKSYEVIFKSLAEHGCSFSNNDFAGVLFAREMPLDLFEVMLSVWDKRSKIFTGNEISQFLLYPHNEELSTVGLKKLNALLKYGAKIDKSGSSDSIFSNLITASLSDRMIDKLDENSYLKDSDVKYLKMAFTLLSRLGANPGPKSRSFWNVMGTQTPWEILDDYRERHRNEPELLKRANEIEKSLPSPEN